MGDAGLEFLKLITLNVNGLHDRHKRAALFLWLTEAQIDIALLQETHGQKKSSSRVGSRMAETAGRILLVTLSGRPLRRSCYPLQGVDCGPF